MERTRPVTIATPVNKPPEAQSLRELRATAIWRRTELLAVILSTKLYYTILYRLYTGVDTSVLLGVKMSTRGNPSTIAFMTVY